MFTKDLCLQARKNKQKNKEGDDGDDGDIYERGIGAGESCCYGLRAGLITCESELFGEL